MTGTPTSAEIEPCEFVTNQVFVTKAGDCGVVLRFKPTDSECMEPDEVAAISRRFEAAMRLITPGYRFYQYLIKRCLSMVGGADTNRAGYLASKQMYSFETYGVILQTGVDSASLFSVARSFVRQVSDTVPCSIEEKYEAFRFFRRLLNYDQALADAIFLKRDQCIDYYMTDSSVEVNREFLRVGDYFVKVLTLKDPPAATTPDLMRVVREIPCECIVASEWKPVDGQEIRSSIHRKTSHFHRSKHVANLFAVVFSKLSPDHKTERPEDMQRDESAAAMEKQLGALLSDIESNGTSVGEFALTTVMFDMDRAAVGNSVSMVVKAMSEKEATLHVETHNLLSAWFAVIPGGYRHQRRAIYMTNQNHADMSFLFAPDTGTPWNDHLRAECLAILETRQLTPYYGNFHYGDVGHALISGMTGSGKSFLANYLMSCAYAKYGARVVIFDIGGSYKALTARIGGAYMEIGLKHDFTINPFSLEPTEENRQFLFSFVKVLVESGEHVMTDVEQDMLFRAIPGTMRLSDLLEKVPVIRPFLSRWTGTGQYGTLFDNAQDTLTCATFQTFDFEGMEEYPQILEPLLFYILHRANADISSRTEQFKVFLLDEAWRFLLNPTVRAYIHASLKTWRKKNAAMWLATQSIGDLESSKMLATVAENCGSLVLMPNPRLDRDEYRRVFKLNEVELDMVATMTPKSESLWKPAVGPAKVLILDVGK